MQKVNGFADLLSEEFNKFYNGFSGKNRDKIPPGEKFVKEGNQLPKSVDWKQKGGVTSVKNQNLCAACYAFAAVSKNLIFDNILKIFVSGWCDGRSTF